MTVKDIYIRVEYLMHNLLIIKEAKINNAVSSKLNQKRIFTIAHSKQYILYGYKMKIGKSSGH